MPSSDDATDVRPSRRTVLAGTTAFLGSLAGCSAVGGDGGDDDGRSPASTNGTPAGSGNATDAGDGNAAAGDDLPVLRIGGSGRVLRIVQHAVRLWNENPPPEEYGDWTPDAYGIDTDATLADYFAGQHGFETTGERTHPPFLVAVSGASTTEAGSDLERGDVDLAATGATPIGRFAPDRLETGSFVEHSIGRTGNVFLVSPAIAEADVALRPAEIRAIYANELTNWSEVGGPDREIAVVTGAAGTPPRPIEQVFFEGVAMEGLDARFGQPQNRHQYLAEHDGAIADLPVRDSFSDDGPQPVPAIVDGERRTFREPGYPAMHPLRLYSQEVPDDRERAFLEYLQSPVVQQQFVQWREGVLPLSSAE